MAQPCRLIELTGSPYERGIQYGRQASPEIGRSIAHYGGQMATRGVDGRQLSEIVAEYLPALEEFDHRQVEEMRGIAAGAGVLFEHILLVNARTELLQTALRPGLRDSLRTMASEGCTGVVVRPEATRDRQLIHAHNWDWQQECANSAVILRIRNQDGPDILTFAEAGALARFGFNARGLCVTGNALKSDRDFRRIGIPLTLIRRRMLEQQYLGLALQIAYLTPKSGSNNLLISHAPSGLAFDFECAPDETFMLEPQNGVLAHSNHWLSSIALTKLREGGMADAPSTIHRVVRTREALAARAGDITYDDVVKTMLDDFDSPWSICYPPRPSNPTNPSIYVTVACLMMRPAAGEMNVAMLPALDQRFTRYTLETERGGAG
ncbi:MAG: acyl-CoA--6-aminopenicillanic acid acyltransferase [Gammaproteobacteria bacterium]|nr:acyl-CoA--6-aminopenicillanic acid acyltransferase [Gammaproteobacteria bacterium]